jgi:hypothetical protein
VSRHDVYPYSGKFAESDRPRFEQFCSVMEQLKEVPVRVHCIASYRASACFYRFRRDVLGMDVAQARELKWKRFGTRRGSGRHL